MQFSRKRSRKAFQLKKHERRSFLEQLEPREMMIATPIKFDFGTATSPLEPGAIRVNHTTSYSASAEFGWQAIANGSSGDVGVSQPDDRRDYVHFSAGVFTADVVPGMYDVTIGMGIAAAMYGKPMRMNDVPVDSVAFSAGQYFENTYRIIVADGQFKLDFPNVPGYGNAILNELEIKPVDPNLNLPVRTEINPAGQAILFYDAATDPSATALSVRKSGNDLQVVNTTSNTVLASAAAATIAGVAVLGQSTSATTLAVDYTTGGYFDGKVAFVGGGSTNDRIELDLTVVDPGAQALVVDTLGKVNTGGGFAAIGNLPFIYFTGIEEIQLHDGGALTSTVIGDLYTRGGSANDNFLFQRGYTSGTDVLLRFNNIFTGPYRPTNRIVAYGRGGNDSITLNGTLGTQVRAAFYGEQGNDSLYGGLADDLLVGGAGSDQLLGGDGHDILWGDDEGVRNSGGASDGGDNLQGGAGNDVIFGGGGNDTLQGGTGDDYLHGGAGNDNITAGDGNDFLRGGDGADTLSGDAGNDIALGGAGDDFNYGSSGRDFHFSGAGLDRAYDLNDNGEDFFVMALSIFDADVGPFAANGRSNNDQILWDLMHHPTTGWASSATFAERVSALEAAAGIGLNGTGAAADLTTKYLYGNTLHPDYTIVSPGTSYSTSTGDTSQTLSLPEIEFYEGSTAITDNTGSLNFGPTGGGSPVDKTLTITNSGAGNLVLDLANVLLPAGFQILSPPSAWIAPGASSDLVLRLTATTAGTFTGTFSVPTNDSSENPYNFAISGTVVAQPEIDVRESGMYSLPSGSGILNFGTAYTGQPVTKILEIVNTGNAILTLSEGTISLPAGISLASSVATEVASGTSTNISFRMDAAAAGSLVGQISIGNNDADENPYLINVQGAVIDYPPEIEISVVSVGAMASGELLSFGTTFIGEPVTHVLQIQNTGAGPLTINTAGISLPTGFSFTSSVPASIPAGSTVTVNLQFNANQVGCLEGSLIIPNNDTDEGMYTIHLSGDAQAAFVEISVTENATELVSSGSPIHWGVTREGIGLSRTFVIANLGTVPLTIDVANITVPTGFSIFQAPDGSVPPQGTTSVVVQLASLEAGTFSGAISIPNNDADENPFVIQAQGEVLPIAADIEVHFNGTGLPASGFELEFGATVEGTPIGKTLTISNTGYLPLTLDLANVQLPAGFSIAQFPASSLEAGESSTLLVQMNATSPGNFGGTLSIPSNDPDESPFTIELAGIVHAALPEIEVRDEQNNLLGPLSTIDFGTFYTTGSATRTLTIGNTGTAALHLSGLQLPAGMSVETSWNPVVAAGSQTTLTLRMQSNSAGSFPGNIVFQTDDLDEAQVSLAVTGTVKTGVAEAYLTSVNLTSDDGLSSQDRVTSDPRVSFIISGIFSGNARLEFDHNGDGSVDGNLPLLVPGETVTYDLRTSDLTFVDYVGGVDLRYRIIFSGQPGSAEQTSPWETFAFTMEAPRVAAIAIQDEAQLDVPDNVGLLEFPPTVAGTPVTRTLTILNSGNGNLVLDWGGAQVPPGFTITSSPPSIIPPEGSGEFVIQLEAASAGDYHGELVLPTNDPTKNPFNFDLFGTVALLAPEIDVRLQGGRRLYQQDQFNFGVTEVGIPLVRGFVIENQGNAPLHLGDPAALTLPAGLEWVTPWPTTVAPGSSATFQLQLAATNAGATDYVVELSTNDADEPSFALRVQGSVLALGQTPPVEVSLSGLTLLNDTGAEGDDWVTYDARVNGQVSFSTLLMNGSVVIDFDHDEDGIADSQTDVNLVTGAFTYDPRQGDPALRHAAGALPLRYRWRVLDESQVSIAIATSWSAQAITLETPPWINDLRVDEVGLVRNLALDSSWSSTDPSLYFVMAGEVSSAQFAVQLDLDGDGIVDQEFVAEELQVEYVFDPRTIVAAWRDAASERTIAYRLQTRDENAQPLQTGAWQTFSFTQQALPNSSLTALVELDSATIVNGLPTSSAPKLVGQLSAPPATVPGTSIQSAVTLEFDWDGVLETVEASTNLLSGTSFEYVPSFSYYGEKTVRVRVREWNPLYGAELTGSWSSPFVFNYLAPVSPAVQNLEFTTPTGVPTITGVLSGNTPFVTIEFDYNGDDTPDGFALSDSTGAFVHQPRGLTLGEANTVRARSSIYDPRAGGTIAGAWTSLTFTPVGKSIATIDSSTFGLLEDNGTSTSDRVTTNPTLTGTIVDLTNPTRALGGITIEFSLAGGMGAAGYATTDSLGKFTYRPVGLLPNAEEDQVISARVVEWDPYSGTYVPGPATTFSFRLLPATFVPAQVISLGQVRHSTASDGVRSDPAIRGQIVSAFNSQPVPYALVQIRLDHAADAQGNPIIAGEVTADAEGKFLYVPTGLSLGLHTISVRTKEWNYANRTGGFGSWVSHALDLQPDTNEPAVLTNLQFSSPAFSTWYGSSDSSDSSFAPVVTGTVSNTQGFQHVLVEFDQNGDGAADGIAQVDSTGAYKFRPAGVTFGTLELYARTLEWDRLSSQYLVSGWSGPYSYNFQPPSASDPIISNVTATRRADGSLLLEGNVSDDQAAQNVLVAFKFWVDGAYIEERSGAVDSSGRFHLIFTHPQAGTGELYRQTTEINPSTGATTQSSWYFQTMPTIATGTVGSLVTDLHLTTDNGWSNNDRVTSIGSITGKLVGDAIAGATVYVNWDGNPSNIQTVTADSQGNFTWEEPTTLNPSQRTLYFSTNSNWNLATWIPFTYTLENPNVVNAQIDELQLLAGADGISTTGAVTGHVSGTNGQPVTIEYFWGTESWNQGTVATAADGTFSLTVNASNGSYVPLRVRVKPAYENSTYRVAEEGWTTLNFFIQSDPNSLESQALRTVMGRFDTSWQTAANQAAPVNPLLANALQQLSNGVYNYQQLQTQADQQRDLARAQAEAAYNAAKATADATRGQALATAAQTFITDLAAFTGDKTVLPLRDFVWPDAPQNVSHTIPQDADQPTAPAGPIYTGQTYQFSQDSGYQELLSSADQVYNQSVQQAQDVYDSAERQASDFFSATKKQLDQTLAAALAQADATYRDALVPGANPYNLTTADAQRVSKRAAAQSKYAREIARLAALRNSEYTRLEQVRDAAIAAKQAVVDHYHYLMGQANSYEESVAYQPYLDAANDAKELETIHAGYDAEIGKAVALREYSKGEAAALKVRDLAFHVADAEFEDTQARHKSYERSREITAAKLRDDTKADARQTHARALSAAAAVRDRALAAAAETLANAITQADAIRWQQKASAAQSTIGAWSSFIENLWSTYQKELVDQEYDYVSQLLPHLLTQATSDHSAAKTAALTVINQREILELAAADLVNVRAKADVAELAIYRADANEQQQIRDLADSQAWKSYLDTKSTNTKTRGVAVAEANYWSGAERTVEYAVLLRDNALRLRSPLTVLDDPSTPQDESGFTDGYYSMREAVLNGKPYAKLAADARFEADFNLKTANGLARKTYDLAALAAEETYHTATIPKYQAFLNKAATHAETLAKDYAQAYVDYVIAVSGADKDAAQELSTHEKTAIEADLQLAATRTIAETAAWGIFSSGTASLFQAAVATWAEGHVTPWGTLQTDLAQLEVERVTQSTTATNTHVAAVTPLASSAAAAGAAQDKNLADEVTTQLDEETASLAAALLAYAEEVALARKTYAQALNAAVATHDMEVVAANITYHTARATAYKTLTDGRAAAEYLWDVARSDRALSYYINVVEGDETPPPAVVQQQEARHTVPAGSFDTALEAWSDPQGRIDRGFQDDHADAQDAAQSTWINSLGLAYIAWNQQLGTAHVTLAQTAKIKADLLAVALKDASDGLSETEADAAKAMLDGLTAAEKTYITDQAETSDQLSQGLATPDDTYSDAQGTTGDAQRQELTAARGRYEVGEFTTHQTRLANTPIPSGPAAAWDGFLRNVAAGDKSQAERDAAARNTYEQTLTNHFGQQRAAETPTGGDAAGLARTTDLAELDKDFSDNLSAAEATIQKSTATAASLAAKTGVVAETQLDLQVALAQQAYDNTVAAAEALYWNELQAAKVTYDHDSREHYWDEEPARTQTYLQIEATYTAAKAEANTKHDNSLKQAKADYATAIGAGKVERAQTQGGAKETYASTVNAAHFAFVNSFSSAEVAHLSGRRQIEMAYIATTPAGSAFATAAATARAIGAAQVTLTASLSNSAATAAAQTAQAEATLRSAEFAGRAALAAAQLMEWEQQNVVPSLLDRWMLSLEREESQWSVAIAPAFVAYVTSTAQAAADEAIAAFEAAYNQSLAKIAADESFLAATEGFASVAEEDNLTAWFDYLDDWFGAQHSDNIARATAQTDFDAAITGAATARAIAYEQADSAQMVDYIETHLPGDNGYLSTNYAGRAAAEVIFATTYGAADVASSTSTAEASRIRKKALASELRDYELRAVEIERKLLEDLAPFEQTRQMALASSQTAKWSADLTASNARRTSDYAALSTFRLSAYTERSTSLNDLGIEYTLPWVAFQAEVADSRAQWWEESASESWLELAVTESNLNSAYQTAKNDTYLAWSTAVAEADAIFATADAEAAFAQRTASAQALKAYVDVQADAERDWQVNNSETRQDEFIRITTAHHAEALAGNFTPYAYEPFVPAWTTTGNSPFNQALLVPHNADYTQRVVPADSLRRLEILDGRTDKLNAQGSARIEYIQSLRTAKAAYDLAISLAHVAKIEELSAASGSFIAENANAWADEVSSIATSSPSPWSERAAIEAEADAVHASEIASAETERSKALAIAENRHSAQLSELEAQRALADAAMQWQELVHQSNSASDTLRSSAIGNLGSQQSLGMRPVRHVDQPAIYPLDGPANLATSLPLLKAPQSVKFQFTATPAVVTSTPQATPTPSKDEPQDAAEQGWFTQFFAGGGNYTAQEVFDAYRALFAKDKLLDAYFEGGGKVAFGDVVGDYGWAWYLNNKKIWIEEDLSSPLVAAMYLRHLLLEGAAWSQSDLANAYREEILEESIGTSSNVGFDQVEGALFHKQRALQLEELRETLDELAENGKIVISLVNDGADLAITLDDAQKGKTSYFVAAASALPLVSGLLLTKLTEGGKLILKAGDETISVAISGPILNKLKTLFSNYSDSHRIINDTLIGLFARKVVKDSAELDALVRRAVDLFATSENAQRSYLRLRSRGVSDQSAQTLAAKIPLMNDAGVNRLLENARSAKIPKYLGKEGEAAARTVHEHHFFPQWLGGAEDGPLVRVVGIEHLGELHPKLLEHFQKNLPAIRSADSGKIEELIVRGKITREQIRVELSNFYLDYFPQLDTQEGRRAVWDLIILGE